MFLFDGEVAMEDLFVYFIKSSTEEILLEMFEDPDFAKNRIVLEIEAYQESKKKASTSF